MENQMDGQNRNLPSLRSTGASTLRHVQPEKLEGTEFSAALGLEDIAKGLYRLGVVYGQPFGSDKDGLRQLATEWLSALADVPPQLFAQAITDWIATERKWPRPLDIRDKSAHKVGTAAFKVGAGAKVHKSRLQPADLMLNYPYMRSKLRSNKQWADFLDSVHPTVEHNYFVEAMFAGNSFSICVPLDFRKDYMLTNLSGPLSRHFGRGISIQVDALQPYDKIPRTAA